MPWLWQGDLDDADYIHETPSARDEDDSKAEQDQEAAVSWLYFHNLHSFIVFKTR
jgi:hypothetical protein